MNKKNGPLVRKWMVLSTFFLLLFITVTAWAGFDESAIEQDLQPTITPSPTEDFSDGEKSRVITVETRDKPVTQGELAETGNEVTAVSGAVDNLAWISYWHLDESSGSTYADPLGGRNGSCTDCPTVDNDGQVGNAQAFDGVNDAISIAANSYFDWSGGDSFTIELWVNAENGQSCVGNEVMVGRGNTAASYWSLGCDENGHVSFQLSDGNTSINLLSTETIDNGNWYHLVATRDGSSNVNSLYINSALATSITQSFTTSVSPTSATLNIGHLNNSTFFEGSLDEVAIYQGVLSQSSIKNHYHLVRDYQSSCDTVDIMPLGNSITRGAGTGIDPGNTWYNYGYRLPLYNSLTSASYDFDFVGSLNNGSASGLPDDDHEGHGGNRADQIAANLNGYLTGNPPDVILLHIGTNDLLQEPPETSPGDTRDDVNSILDEVEQFDRNITVILAQVVGQGTGTFSDPFSLPMKQIVLDYNALIPPLVQSRATDGGKVVLVDMYAPLGPANVYSSNMYDNVHPNELGYNKMAPVWFNALEDFLPNCTSPIVNSTAITETTTNSLYTYQVGAVGNPVPVYSLQTAPAGMNIDAATGQISWTPTVQQTGLNQVTVLATNSEGVESHTFSINVQDVVYIPFVIR